MRILSFIACILLLLTSLSFLRGAEWTYSGQTGQDYWSNKYPYCASPFQSPIDITSDLLRFSPALRPIEVRNYKLSSTEQLSLRNDGHSLQLSLPPTMYVSGLPNQFTAAQLHFHWGSSHRPTGSEHLVDSKQFAAELHIVHYNSDKYPDIKTAMDKSDGLAVLGVLIKIGDFNPAYEHIMRFINGAKNKNFKVQVPGFNIRELLPARLDEFYRYDGSLTTPPCFPSVLWTVFRNHVTISHQQYLALATSLFASSVQDPEVIPLNNNFRKPQPIDSRVVLVSFKEGRGLHGILTVSPPFMRKRVVQQLLAGDLADLADEGLYQLLPSGSQTLQAGKKKDPMTQQSVTLAKPKQQTKNPSLWKKSQTNCYVGKLGMAENTLCYTSLEQSVSHQLKQSHTGNELIEALKDTIYPELNLKSYLDCKSDLALSTIRRILCRRPTDEALELDRSLTKAFMNHKKTSVAPKHEGPRTKHGGLSSAVPQKPLRQHHPHPWLLPMEWED
ncbi:carbonic anhydrase 12 isoform X1 [Poeciliopsis prolifica]|uniref:carbonic anhydrase 12 isoform X1 n=1 Tax=Poeciliopsis prolifica TaxID=188132 RepID=UPI00241382B3|nr:carbonic anhydrase 12 isoform X1 [Poeciliopsis prolifica]